MKKRIIATIITTAMLLGMLFMFPISTSAETEWDGVSSTAFWGEGTKSSPYLIKTANNLKYFQKQVNQGNNFAGKYLVLTQNINLYGKEWTPIGSSETTAFSGVFDGQGYMVSGLSITTYTKYCGLFGVLKPNGYDCIVLNLKLSGVIELGNNVILTDSLFCGGVAGISLNDNRNHRVIISNCSSMVSQAIINTQSSSHNIYVGGLVGSANFTSFYNCCNNNGTITALLGCDLTNDGLKSVGNATGLLYVGGIASIVYDCEFASCTNTAKLFAIQASVNNSLDYVGGIVGACSTSNSGNYTTFAYCANVGWADAVSLYKGASVGGIVGSFYNSSVIIQYCYNSGLVEGTVNQPTPEYIYIGGIAGSYNYQKTKSLSISNCYNSENIGSRKGTGSGAGGILGYAASDPQDSKLCFINNNQTTTSKIIGYGSATTQNCKVNITSFDTLKNKILDEMSILYIYDLSYALEGSNNIPIDTPTTTRQILTTTPVPPSTMPYDTTIPPHEHTTKSDDNITTPDLRISCGSSSTLFSLITIIAFIGGSGVVLIIKKKV